MGVSPIEARELTLGEYVNLTEGWVKAHEDPNAPLPAPSADWWERQQERIAASPHLTH